MDRQEALKLRLIIDQRRVKQIKKMTKRKAYTLNDILFTPVTVTRHNMRTSRNRY